MAGDETRITRTSELVTAPGVQGGECLVQIYGPTLGMRYVIGREPMVIGRDAGGDVVLEADSVSRRHAVVERGEAGVVVRDLGSTNGTYINDAQIESGVLRHGDLLKVGGVILKFLAGGDAESAFHEAIYRLTIEDGLTEIPNRRYLDDFLEREWSRARRHRRPLSVVIFDIDHFKNINDSYGHITGDHVLREMAKLVRERVRREEVVARYGGEEFVAVLPETDGRGARQFAEQIRVLVEGHAFVFDGESIMVTVSAGVSELLPDLMDKPAELLKAADRNLYKAKEAGRNQVVGG